jgi:hypothetical protein
MDPMRNSWNFEIEDLLAIIEFIELIRKLKEPT